MRPPGGCPLGFYRRYLFPWLLEWGLGRPTVEAERRAALLPATGRVLEVGFGFGGSLAAYPDGATGARTVVGLDPHTGLLRRAARRAARVPFAVERVRGSAATLPFPDRAFDTVVSQFTICSLPDPAGCLREMGRVLAPHGRLLFLEHGQSADPGVARMQARLAPLFRVFGDGCRPDLPIDAMVRDAGFRIETLERYELGLGPRAARSMYRGVACAGNGTPR